MNLCKPICIAENKTASVVIVSKEFPRAAAILAKYLNKITDAEFTIQETTTVYPSIVLKCADHGESGFLYRIFDKDIEIEAGNGQAMVYAVYDWLERVAGCRYYSRTYEYIPFDANLTVCFEEYQFSPILQYREIHYRDFFDPEFAEKHKIVPQCKRDENWGFWCHSFGTLCSPEEYFDEHPEYFSLYEGKRVGKNAQLCLSNPDVFDIVLKNLKKHMDENPKAKYWSVSQNDNAAYCQCEKCREMNERDGSPMGSVLNFVNRIAEHFPDKVISTLAYWYTRKAPAITRPAENVHIMLCNIEANRGLPIETDEKSSGSRQELLDWKEICQNVFLWDYCVQFRNLVSPFPNLRVLGPNIRFFVENNVRSLFSQSNREIGGEFHELRGYLLAKLMWDPYINEREVMIDFLNGYYKQAGPVILQYIDLIHDEMEKAGGELNIFGGPLDAKDTYMREDLFRQYEALFGEAISLTQGDADTQFRVKTAALPIYYAGIVLEYGDREEKLRRIEKFAEQARKTGLVMVEEWKITVDKFVTDAMAKI
ncbi:MAG TPA: DUF4838 domain-containing protein [Candidatus Merdivicinus excrementipullorum]|uniref:DUF4838 domain-containing protein n=1 Tax=Candidatus Merdivicinus excrementipullorum TaxID=2840867 RepID=A0A9D1JZW7_9FIRM|nr:DUF4838 domain-containing protein [Candidatus Merdivicinus excrementipullorum]